MIKGKYLIRYATKEDVKNYYQDAFKQSAKMMVLESEGKILGIAGVTYERDKMVAFSDMKENIPPKIIVWAAKQFLPLLMEVKAPIIAVASGKYPNSRRFLEHLGFRYIEKQLAGDVFIWNMQQPQQ